MKKVTIICLLISLGLVGTVSAQIVIGLDEVQHPTETTDLQDALVLDDEQNTAMVIWAPPDFSKKRIGAPTYEQIFVLEGEGTFTFEGEAKKVKRGSWVVIPANTPHRVEVTSQEILKMMAVQKK